jgi:hypothetical protein
MHGVRPCRLPMPACCRGDEMRGRPEPDIAQAACGRGAGGPPARVRRALGNRLVDSCKLTRFWAPEGMSIK